jgi:hypothetical protein
MRLLGTRDLRVAPKPQNVRGVPRCGVTDNDATHRRRRRRAEPGPPGMRAERGPNEARGASLVARQALEEPGVQERSSPEAMLSVFA